MPRVLLSLLAALVPLSLPAQTLAWKQVVPDTAATAEGATSVALPFGSSLARHLLYAYDGSAVGYARPVRIAAISLRCDGATGGASAAGNYNFALDLSTSRNAVGALDLTFANNHGADRLRVRSGALAIPAPPVGAAPNAFGLRIPFTTPFDWDPRNGPLLLDFGYQASTVAFGSWDAVNAGVAGLSASGATAVLATATLTAAPVVELEVVGDVVPSIHANTEASASTSVPWGRAAGLQTRSLTVYEGSVFGFVGRRRITALAWRTDAGGAFTGRDYTVRISLSTSPVTGTTMSQTFANNHGTDVTVVFDGVLQAAATSASPDLGHFDLFCELARPFEYDSAEGALAVDVQLFNGPGSPSIFDAAVSTAGVGRLFDNTSATATMNASPQAGVALVMALRTVAVPTVPAALANTCNPSPTDSTNFPFGIGNCRSLQLGSAAEAGITQPFVVRHLRFRPSNAVLAAGPSTFALTIDLSHAATTPATVSVTFDSNHGSDRVRVFDGQISVPFFDRGADDPGFPIEVKLQKPFLWSPATAPYLAIDMRMLAIAGSSISIETTSTLVHDDARVTASNSVATTGTAQTLAAVVQLGGDGQNGLAVNQGTGCLGTNGTPLATTVGLPSLPNPDLQMRVRNAAGNAAAFFIAGFAQLNVPLPGTPNCLVLNAGEAGVLGAVVTSPAGDGSIGLPLIGAPVFDGFQFRGQWWILDPTANSLGIVTSGGQLYTARWF